MARYQKRLDIWSLSPEQRSSLQPGQWVEAGPGGPRGVFCGVKQSGTVVVLWLGNAKHHPKYLDYLRTMLDYANDQPRSA